MTKSKEGIREKRDREEITGREGERKVSEGEYSG